MTSSRCSADFPFRLSFMEFNMLADFRRNMPGNCTAQNDSDECTVNMNITFHTAYLLEASQTQYSTSWICFLRQVWKMEASQSAGPTERSSLHLPAIKPRSSKRACLCRNPPSFSHLMTTVDPVYATQFNKETLQELNIDLLCGIIGRVPGHRTEMYCVSYEVQTQFVYMLCRRK
jgi:hypothetical protein